MKNILSILLVSGLLFGCGGENRILIDELTNKGTEDSPIMYYESELFSGIGFDIYEDGELQYESNYKDGKENGFYKEWYENGQLRYEGNYKDGKEDGIHKGWYKNGQMEYESNSQDGKEHGEFWGWNQNGQITFEALYNDGKCISGDC